MINKEDSQPDLQLLVWFLAFTFTSAIWGIFAAGIAFNYSMPFDFFQIYPESNNQYNMFLLGMSYGAGAAVTLVMLEKLGAYNPVIAFVVLMGGIILFIDMLFGRTGLQNPQHLVWLMLVPIVIIRDIVTFYYLRDRYRSSGEIHEIDITCQTLDEPCFTEAEQDQKTTEKETKKERQPNTELGDIEQLALEMSSEAAEYGKQRAGYLRA